MRWFWGEAKSWDGDTAVVGMEGVKISRISRYFGGVEGGCRNKRGRRQGLAAVRGE